MGPLSRSADEWLNLSAQVEPLSLGILGVLDELKNEARASGENDLRYEIERICEVGPHPGAISALNVVSDPFHVGPGVHEDCVPAEVVARIETVV